MEKADVAMVGVGCVLRGVPRVYSIARNAYGLLFGQRILVRANRAGENRDGVRDGGLPANSGGGHHDDLPNAPYSSQWTPPYVIGGVAMVFLFVYAFKNGLDNRLSDLVSGIVGVLIGMRIGKNGAKS